MADHCIEGTKYWFRIRTIDGGFSALWSCPICGACEIIASGGHAESELRQLVIAKSREHHAEAHTATPGC